MYYAQLTSGIVTGVTETHSALPVSPDLVQIDSLDTTLLGYTYDGETFTPPAALAPRRLSKLGYMLRFTDAELVEIYSAAKESVAVEVWLAKFNLATPDPDGTAIGLDDPRTIAGLQALEAAGLIAPGRAAEIVK